MTTSAEAPYLFSQEQIRSYLIRIALQPEESPAVELQTGTANHELLSKLMKHQISSVPFENLSLHYSIYPGVSIDIEEVYSKIVERKRGGYCMELNLLFGTVLRTLGYEVVSAGARVATPAGFGGWSHQVSLVRISGTIYAVDVGFGGSGPTRPLPLINGRISKWGATDAEMRLTYKNDENSFTQGLWTYEHRISSSDEWRPMYCFGLTEFFAGDFEVMNFSVSNRKTSWFTRKILCALFIYDKTVDDIIGVRILDEKQFKERVQSTTVEATELKSEAERVSCLEKKFGLFLERNHQAAIKGTIAELS